MSRYTILKGLLRKGRYVYPRADTSGYATATRRDICEACKVPINGSSEALR